MCFKAVESIMQMSHCHGRMYRNLDHARVGWGVWPQMWSSCFSPLLSHSFSSGAVRAVRALLCLPPSAQHLQTRLAEGLEQTLTPIPQSAPQFATPQPNVKFLCAEQHLTVLPYFDLAEVAFATLWFMSLQLCQLNPFLKYTYACSKNLSSILCSC